MIKVGTYTLKRQSVIGDWRVSFYTCTNFTDGDTVTVNTMNEIYFAKANTDIKDVSVGVAIGTNGNDNIVTFDENGTGTYDGTLTVIGK